MTALQTIAHTRGATLRYLASFPPEIPVASLTVASLVRTPGGQRLCAVAAQVAASGNAIELVCDAAVTASWPIEVLHWLTSIRQASGDVQILHVLIDTQRGMT